MEAGSQNVDDFGFHLWPTQLLSQLSSLEDIRIEDMNHGEIALQVVSSIPCSEPADICRDTNKQLAGAVKKSQGRLAGFATLPMDDPSAAAQEYEHSIRCHGFVGAMIPNHAHGKYYDTDGYRIFWRQAAALHLPVYIHPCPPSEALKPLYRGNYPDKIATILSVGGWGWHADTAVHFIKLYCSGIFDEFPNLKIVIGHAGEMLPYMINRVNARLERGWGARRRDLKTVWRENLWITISGIWDLAPFSCLIRSIPMDRIMFSVDWPFEKNETGREFMKTVRDSGIITEEEWEMISWKNAEKLLGVKRPA